MGQGWQTVSRRAALQFWKESLAYGSLVFVVFTSIRWVLKGKPPYNLIELWLVLTFVLGPLITAIRHLVIEAFLRW